MDCFFVERGSTPKHFSVAVADDLAITQVDLMEHTSGSWTPMHESDQSVGLSWTLDSNHPLVPPFSLRTSGLVTTTYRDVIPGNWAPGGLYCGTGR